MSRPFTLHRNAVVDMPKQKGYPLTAQTVRGHGAGERNIAIGHPTDDGALTFTFRRGDPVYKQLVTTPGLRALITVDRTGGIRGVTFRGRTSTQ